MDEAVQVIVDTLEELNTAHRQLITLGLEKRDAILANATDAVASATNRETKVIQKTAELDRQRLLAVGKYLVKRGVAPTNSFRMTQLIQMVYKAEEKQSLQAACEQLSATLKELQDINDFNQQMMKLNLEYIAHSLDIIAGPSEDEATYHRSLQSEGFKRFSQFDTKA
ncbi:flagellar protein FlgN [Paenibacillus pinihumi]|uniref:flagellar protein FlgN n=1 Tax=Paenibacillus pinihumi TaxID=669462 RepID=UPI0003F97026|nr:flagellar protein FlgN [Paenibacillus pinihumi]